jgi:hypothetical protein
MKLSLIAAVLLASILAAVLFVPPIPTDQPLEFQGVLFGASEKASKRNLPEAVSARCRDSLLERTCYYKGGTFALQPVTSVSLNFHQDKLESVMVGLHGASCDYAIATVTKKYGPATAHLNIMKVSKEGIMYPYTETTWSRKDGGLITVSLDAVPIDDCIVYLQSSNGVAIEKQLRSVKPEEEKDI